MTVIFFLCERRQAFFGTKRVGERTRKVVVHQHAEFPAFGNRRLGELCKTDLAVVAFGIESGFEYGLFDMAAAQFKVFAKEFEGDVVADGCAFGKGGLEKAATRFGVGHGEIDAVTDTSLESVVDASFEVGGENRDPFEVLHALQKIGVGHFSMVQ